MPTKPSAEPPQWASNANYTGGPDQGKPTRYDIPVGIAAEGHRAGKNDPTLAQYFNDWLALVWALIHWLYLGSSAGEANAHVLETDTIGNVDLAHLHVHPPDGYVEAEGAFFEANDTGYAARFRSANSSPVVQIQNVSTGVGMTCTAVGATAGTFTGGTGPTVPALAAVGLLNAPGILGTGGPGGANGVEGVGTGSRAGVQGTGSVGIYGETTNLTVGNSIFGFLGAGAGVGASAVRGVAQDAGIAGRFISEANNAVDAEADSGRGVSALSQTGVGVWAASGSGHGTQTTSTSGNGLQATSTNGHAGFFSAAGDKATVRINPRLSTPSDVLEGNLWTRSSQGLVAHLAKNGGAAALRHIFDTAGGMALALNSAAGPDSVDVQTNVVTATMTGNNAPVATGTVFVLAVVEVGREAGATADVLVRVLDDTAAVQIYSDTHQLFHSGAGNRERHVVVLFSYTLPAAGNRSFTLQLTPDPNGGDFINWANAALLVLGVF